MRKVVLWLVVIAAAAIVFETPLRAQNKAGSGKGAVLKTPDRFMQAPLSDFNGMLLLNPDAAAAIVVSYPNKGESLDDLNKRLLLKVPGFFNKVKPEETVWTSKPVETRASDKANSGILYSGKSADTLLQFVSYQREINGLTLIYGYFAMRGPKSKDGEAKKYWLDENAKGVKPFEEFANNLAKNNP